METFWGLLSIVASVLVNIISHLTYNERYHVVKFDRDIKYDIFITSIFAIWLSVVSIIGMDGNGFYIGFWYCILIALAVPITWIGAVMGRTFYSNLLDSMLPNLIKKINKGIDLALIFKRGLFKRTKKLGREASHNNEEIKLLEALVEDLSRQVAILPENRPLAVLTDDSLTTSGKKPKTVLANTRVVANGKKSLAVLANTRVVASGKKPKTVLADARVVASGKQPLAVLTDNSVAGSGKQPAPSRSRYSSSDPGIRAMEDQLSDI